MEAVPTWKVKRLRKAALKKDKVKKKKQNEPKTNRFSALLANGQLPVLEPIMAEEATPEHTKEAKTPTARRSTTVTFDKTVDSIEGEPSSRARTMGGA